jgi:hypothetical protein
VTTIVIGCIVEGHGETRALPVLIRRLAQEIAPTAVVEVPSPVRVPKDRLLKEGELERAVERASGPVDDQGGILILLDSDDDCPALKGPELLDRARRARSDRRVAVVLAKREYEAWLLAGAASLQGQRGLPADLDPPANPEGIRGAKEWLRKRMEGDLTYSAPVDQPALTAALDIPGARNASDSFDKCCREIERLLRAG